MTGTRITLSLAIRAIEPAHRLVHVTERRMDGADIFGADSAREAEIFGKPDLAHAALSEIAEKAEMRDRFR